jgi:uncharacterized membrane protein YedE/YeeE
MRQPIGTLLLGAYLGFVLSRIGFSSWDEVHGMFVFSSLRLLLTFMFGVCVLGVTWIVTSKWLKPEFSPRPIHPGTLAGGAIFGIGWALSGACPAIAFVQLGDGQLAALWTLLGIFGGNWLYGRVHARFFRWTPSVCADA